MVIGVCTIELSLPGAFSLKDKRQVLQSLIRRLHNSYNVSIAEVDLHDSVQAAVLGVACVATEAAYAHGLLTKVVSAIEQTRLDAVLANFQIELF